MTPLSLQRESLLKGVQIRSGGKVKEAEEVWLLHLWVGDKGFKIYNTTFPDLKQPLDVNCNGCGLPVGSFGLTRLVCVVHTSYEGLVIFTFPLHSNLHMGFGTFFCLCKVVKLLNGQRIS